MPELQQRLQAALAGRYRIAGQVGRGGTAWVYRAEDLRHHRSVALKVLDPALAASLGSARFLREIEIAARLTHPHILPLHDSGEAAGLLYYVMPHVEGQTLRKRLEEGPQFSLEEALRVAREVADALDYAHAQGVIHRDIKPENIFVSHGHALVADFGIARAVSEAAGDALTATGLAVGTPAYMSPEQAAADARLDPRSDLYSLACVVYEMLAGQPPFAGPSARVVMARHVAEAVPPVRAVREGVPEIVERALTRALAKSPADRFGTAGEFVRALEAPSLPAPEHSVAVLPFANLSHDPEDEYFSDGMTEEIITAASAVKALRVVARTSAFAFKGKTLDVRTVGRQLNVATVLEGSVRRAGRRLRITAQLIDVANGYHIWSERYDRDLEDVFAIQDEIASSVARALQVVLTEPKQLARERPPTKSLEAYDFFLRGRQLFHQFRRKGFEAARQMFQRAVELDPAYARAHAAIADCWSMLHHLDATEENARGADEASRKALELDPEAAEARASRGLALAVNGRYEEAEREFQAAIQLDPKLFEAYYFHARASFANGNFVSAAEMFEHAIAVRPEDYQAAAMVVMVYERLGRPAEAEAATRRAAEKVERHLELNPYDVRALYLGAGMWARLHDRARAEEWAKRALAMEPDDPAVAYNVACVFADLGEVEAALDCLERGAKLGLPGGEWLERDPDLDPLRGHPRFQAIIAAPTRGTHF
ncbi:MAG: hypothetical protein DMD73_11335 [Gemmatimonadetes bacterium]|nr:MAG: hypothetical protein DMD73_11335 [Gemmatimonadota bacterium]